MRVLHVIPGLALRTGGPAVAVVESALALRALGAETAIVATDLAAAASAADGAGRVRRDELPPGADQLDVTLVPARRPHRLAFAPRLPAVLRRRVAEADVVHVHSLFLFPQLAAYRAARAAGVPYIVSPSGALDPQLRGRSRVAKALAGALWQDRMLQQAAALHFKTDDEAALTADLGLRAPAIVVPNGIRWEAFQGVASGRAFRERYLAGSDAPLVLNHGRLSHKKNLDVLVRGFAAARARVPDAQLVLAGPDDEGLRPALEALAREADIADATRFVGLLARDELLPALAAADAWALPSRTENFATAAVEALAAGAAVVLSPAVNIAADVEREGAGVVCAAEPDALGRELASLLLDADRRACLSARARAFARRFDWSHVAPRWLQMYEGTAAA